MLSLISRRASLFTEQTRGHMHQCWVSPRTLFLRAYLQLVRFDLLLARGTFSAIRENVHSSAVRRIARPSDIVDRVCAAVDLASVCYWKKILCLQRSAVIACLLKRAGVPAEMVIGVQPLPFAAHAWVEAEGTVAGDGSDVRSLYQELDRF